MIEDCTSCAEFFVLPLTNWGENLHSHILYCNDKNMFFTAREKCIKDPNLIFCFFFNYVKLFAATLEFSAYLLSFALRPPFSYFAKS